jgi:hypothetical protein
MFFVKCRLMLPFFECQFSKRHITERFCNLPNGHYVELKKCWHSIGLFLLHKSGKSPRIYYWPHLTAHRRTPPPHFVKVRLVRYNSLLMYYYFKFGNLSLRWFGNLATFKFDNLSVRWYVVWKNVNFVIFRNITLGYYATWNSETRTTRHIIFNTYMPFSTN